MSPLALVVVTALPMLYSPLGRPDNLSSQPSLRIELGIHFDFGTKPSVSLNGIPLRPEPNRAAMSCDTPEACRRMTAVMLGAGALSIIFLNEIARQRAR
jgi:hypothetical protein